MPARPAPAPRTPSGERRFAAEPWLTFVGSFIADCAFRTPRLPGWGQTLLGSGFRLGPGGKGSNQAIAAARLGGRIAFIGKIGRDRLGELARETWQRAGVDLQYVFETAEHPTGAAAVIVDDAHGENAIVVDPGAGMCLTTADLDRAAGRIAQSAVLVTQLEIPTDTAERGLALARHSGVQTILNPAPALTLPDRILALCDVLTPNAHEAEALTGRAVNDITDAERAAEVLRGRGAGHVVITLGGQGALLAGPEGSTHVRAVDAGPVVDTTGAGDAFTGALAVGLAEGRSLHDAVRFASAAAGLSVTRPGTAVAMPTRAEVEALLGRD